MKKNYLHLILLSGILSAFFLDSLTAQCTLTGTYNNTAGIQTAINLAAAVPCSTITLSGTANWSGDVTIPSTATFVIANTATITGNGTITSTNNIIIASGGTFYTNNNTVTINGSSFNNLGTIVGPQIISSTGQFPLPIELLFFTANPSTDGISLNWHTTSELNNEKFQIERSADSKTFQVIGEVTGAGTTLEKREYQFTDRSPLPGVNYYRLKQMDYDGQFEYTPVRSVMMRTGKEVSVYPTLTQGPVQIVLPEETDETASVSVYNLQGSLQMQHNYQPQSVLSLDISKLSAGQYIIKVKTGYQTTQSRVFRVE